MEEAFSFLSFFHEQARDLTRLAVLFLFLFSFFSRSNNYLGEIIGSFLLSLRVKMKI